MESRRSNLLCKWNLRKNIKIGGNMKKLIFLLTLLISFNAYAAPPTRVSSYTTGTAISSTAVTANEDALFTYLQGGVDTLASNAVDSAGEVAANVIGASELNNSGDFTVNSLSSTTTLTATTTVTASGVIVQGPLSDGTGSVGSAGQYLRQSDGESLWQTGGFTPRGDIPSWDFVVGDLTTDGNWNDLDLSSIVPSGAVAVLLHIQLNEDAVRVVAFRRNGDPYNQPRSRIGVHVASVLQYQDLIVQCDPSRVIEYKADNATWTGISIAVRGWWF
jgi:hypothetical protein